MSGQGGVPSEIVSCMSAGREPSVDELFRVAKRIRADCQGQSSAFAWDDRVADSEDWLVCLRAAHAALCGGID
jgi:hypothetical protein